MTGTLVLILLLAALILLWLDGARAREIAAAVADEMCGRRGFQFLDGTVALTRVSLARTPSGVRIRRIFAFDYSVEGTGRLRGHVHMQGSRPVDVAILDNGSREDTGRAGPPSEDDKPFRKEDNVLPFRRRR